MCNDAKIACGEKFGTKYAPMDAPTMQTLIFRAFAVIRRTKRVVNLAMPDFRHPCLLNLHKPCFRQSFAVRALASCHEGQHVLG